MSTFTIDSDNNIQAHAKAPASGNPAEVFSTPKELATLTAQWPATRLVEVWNSFAGIAPFQELKPVKKFTNRKTALARIWEAIQRLATVAEPARQEAPAPKKARKSPLRGKRRDTARTRAKDSRSGATLARDGSKKAEVLDLLQRAQGATLPEIMELTGWQAHTVRGFISGTLNKKLGLTVESSRPDGKERTYKVKA
jgi:hypothetical protein